MAGPKKRLGEMLIEAGIISVDTLQHALALQKEGGRKLGTVLMEEGFIDEKVLLDFLRRQLNIEVVSSTELTIDEGIWDKVPEELIKKYVVLPLRLDGGQLTIAMSDPFNLAAIDDLRFATNTRKVHVVMAAESTIEAILKERFQTLGLLYDIIDHGELYKKALEMIDSKQMMDIPLDAVVEEEESASSHVIQLESESPPIISLVNYIFYEAHRRKASDIHVEPYQTYFRIRFRIDGILYTVLTPPRRLAIYIASRLKIMSGMDIAKKMVPQDGHLALRISQETIHYRVSTLPTVYGEKCVLRVLRKQQHLENVDSLGFDAGVLTRYKKQIALPQGMILYTGPTGSGKTTTLYASLNHVNTPNINIITLEDPVESTLYGINHVQIRSQYGLTFADGLRSILRQDPDIIFVGEIRDGEVAEIALRAAMTGHLVFSTLHANTTADTFERLVDMGVEPYLVSTTLLCVVAQRLLRRVCLKCRQRYTPTVDEIVEFGLVQPVLEHATLYRGEGCGNCMNTGYSGRVAAFEVLFISPALRRLIKGRAAKDEIYRLALEEGLKTMHEDGLDKVCQGLSTLDEIRRVIVAGGEEG